MAKLFSDIAGQKRAVGILSAHLNSGNLSHAYLFLGEAGTGKEYLARRFSKYILCPNGADDLCDSCRRVDLGNHPDLFIINGQKRIIIDDIRDAIERINLSPSLSKKKVLLIPKIENIGLEAANALLKTLEEPPLDSVIIMTTSSEKKLPQTISSRAQMIRMNILEPDEVKRILAKDHSNEKITEVLDLSGGNIGEAKKLIDNPTYFKSKIELQNDVKEMLSASSLMVRLKIIDTYDKRKKLKAFYQSLVSYLAEKIENIDQEDDQEQKIKYLFLSNKILKINRKLEYNISLRIALEEMMIEDSYNDQSSRS